MALDAGQLLQDRYRIVTLLGEGGMGAVYRAWDTRLNVAVALKEMRPQPGLDPATLAGLREQFRQEATILARLSHPNLVRVTDFFEEGSNSYLVMDFVLGESLADKLTREGPQSEAQVIEWGRQLLDALAYCHAEGIIHRDIKPQNVIIHPNGKAMLVDFGLVKLWNPNDPRTQTIMRGMGTPEYAPPEQYDTQSSHTDARSDLYSLGATLYHALTGQAPPTATQRMAMPGAFKSPRTLNARISPALEAVISQAMELQLDRRFPSAAAMLDALVSQRPAPAMPSPIPAEAPSTYQPSAPPLPSAAAYPPLPSAGQLPPSPSAAAYSPLPSTVQMPSAAPAAAYSPSPSAGQLPPAPPAAAYPSFPSAGQLPPSAAEPPKKRRSPWVWILGGLGALILGASIICGLVVWLGNGSLFGGGTATPTAIVGVPPTSLPELATPTSRVVVPPTSGPTAVPATGSFQITVDNYSGYTICYVQISSSEAEDWGEDWLGGDEYLYPDDSRAFEVPAGAYDVRVSDCDEMVLATAWGVSDDYTLTVGGPGLVALQVKNESSVEICYVYISDVTADSWGEDWLGTSESIAAQGGQRIFFLNPGTYDLLVQDCDGNDLVSEFQVEFQSDKDWTISD